MLIALVESSSRRQKRQPIHLSLHDHRMPLHWTIDSKTELVTACAEGPLTFADVTRFVEVVVESGALTYRRLIDLSTSQLAMDASELMVLGAMVRDIHKLGPMGPLAIVVTDSMFEAMSRLLGILAIAPRPMRVFSQTEPARQWIENVGAQRPSSTAG